MMGKTILLADKSLTIQKIVELTFSDENYEIKCVNDGQSALDAIPALNPSIILADINLPVKSGYDICQTVRKDPAFAAFSSVPVVLLAGIYETMDEERAKQVEARMREVGANDLLSKPFDPQVLTAKVKELMSAGAPAEVPVAAAPAPPASGDIFTSMPETAEPPIETPSDLFAPSAPPPDDSEKTMMLPSFSFSENMFAEAPPLEEAPHAAPPADVASMTPASEPVFEMSDMENAPEPVVEEPAEPEPVAEEMPESGPFAGREEMEFSFDTKPGVTMPAAAPEPEMPFSMTEAAPEPEAPFGEPEAAPAPAAPMSFVAAPDEPFGDVFAEAPAPAWTAPASEEDSPFGVPEPPPAPVAEPEPVMEAESVEAPALPEMPPEMPMEMPIEEPWSVQEPSYETAQEEPAPQAPEPVVEDNSQKVLKEMMAAQSLKPDFGEDTWSRARKVAEGPVEELFEAEPARMEEAVELHPDLSEQHAAPAVAVGQEFVQEVPSTPVVTGGAVEITDELIDRIAARVVAKLSEKTISEIVWQVVPDLAEKMIRRELEKLHAGEE